MQFNNKGASLSGMDLSASSAARDGGQAAAPATGTARQPRVPHASGYRPDVDGLRAVAHNPGIAQAALDASIRRQYVGEPCHLASPQADVFCKADNGTASGVLLVVSGDSHAGAWLPVFAKIAYEHNLRLMLFSHPGCPPLLAKRRSDGAQSGEFCAHLGLAAQRAILFEHEIAGLL